MTFKDKELVQTKITRTVIREAAKVLDDILAPQRAMEDLVIEQTDVETAKKASEQGESSLSEYLAKNKELTKKLIDLQREQTPDKMAEQMYRLFVVAVDKTGWSEEDKQEFASDANLDTYDYSEVQEFTNSFRAKLPTGAVLR